MLPLTGLLLLALGAPSDAETHYPGASAVFQCTFDSSREDDFYGWPPGWTRRHGPGFPGYVRVRLDNDHPPPGGCSLRVELDGGAATAYGPDVPVIPGVRYVLEGYLTTSGLRHDSAYLSLIFLGSKGTKISSIASEKIGGDSPWQRICVGPVSPPAGAVCMWIGLHVEPQGQMQDLRGTASFGALWLGQLPRIGLTAQPIRQARLDKGKAGRPVSDEKREPSRGGHDTTFLLFPRGQPIEIACLVSGFVAPAYEIRMELLDFEGHNLAERRQSFNQPRPAAKTSLQGPEMQVKPQMQSTPTFGRMAWRLPIDALGFYRVRAIVVPVAASVQAPHRATGRAAATTPQAELSLAIIEPQSLPRGSEFGWSLSPNDARVGLVSLAELLCQSGIGWVKYPFAIEETTVSSTANESGEKTEKPAKKVEDISTNPGRISSPGTTATGLGSGSRSKVSEASSLDSLINFSDQLATAGIQLAGVLQPPRVAADGGKKRYDLLAAEAFSRDPKTWYPSIEPILARLGTEIRVWQIGDDRDPGWMGRRDMRELISRTKAELDKIGQDLAVGIAWNLAAPLPILASVSRTDRPRDAKASTLPAAGLNTPKPPWHFLSLPCDESVSDDEIARRLDSTKSAGVARWILLDIEPREGHSTRERIVHLIDRMMTAKMHGAETIFLSDPLDPDRGLADRNGSPGELFLPWRTTALLLGGRPYVGDIDLPRGNQIHCFGSKAEYWGVIAGGKAGEETVYLGPELRTQDLWGNSRPCSPTIVADDAPTGLSPAPQSAIAIEQLPIFLSGLDGPVTQWQLGVALSPNRLPSIPSAMATVTMNLTNTLPQSIAGHVSIRGPKNWYIEPRTAEFRLDPGAPWTLPLEVALPNDVVAGRQMVRLNFEIQADRLYRFAMYRALEVTSGDVTFEGWAVLNRHGEIEVRQTLANQGRKEAGFRCDLLAPDRRRQSCEAIVQPSGKSEHMYRLPDGEQLLGKALWLRAEEIDGPRVLNYRLEAPTATPPTTPSTTPAETPKHRSRALHRES